MPSPLGHALAGFAAGWLVDPDPARPADCAGGFRAAVSRIVHSRRAWTYAAVGVAADLDLLAGLHSRYTHSVGVALGVSYWLARRRSSRAAWFSMAIAASYSSHVLLDWLAEDTTPPIGIMALWPFSSGFYMAPFQVFLGISRKYWLASAWKQDLVSVARELLILVPVAAVVALCRPGRR